MTFIFFQRISNYMIHTANSRQAIFIILICFLFPTISNAQEIGLNVDFLGYADNREFKNSQTPPKTYFGSILSPQFNFQISEKHQLIAGFHYQNNFGKNNDNNNNVTPIMYYNYSSSRLNFAIGSMPRAEKLKNISRFILADTMYYDRPNLEGMHLEYTAQNYKQHLYIDWLNKQGLNYREQFLVGTRGRWNIQRFFIENEAVMFHNSLSSNDDEDEHIQDNMTASIRIGVDLTKVTFLATLRTSAGVIANYDRVRTKYEHINYGFIHQLELAYKHFFIKNSMYLGDGVYSPHADPFYQSKKYNRLDLGWKPFKKGNIEGVFTASFHFTDQATSNQQSFLLRYNFDQRLFAK